MLELEKAIKKIIERYLVNITPIIKPISAGDTNIFIQSTRRYSRGDSIVVYFKPNNQSQSVGEVHRIKCVLDRNTIVLENPVQNFYPMTSSFVEKMIGYDETGSETFIEAVYTGDPEIIPRYPAITVNGVSRKSQWFTLESTQEHYTIEITVYVTAADYEAQRGLMLSYTKAIETALFRSFYPLVEPYWETTLLNDVAVNDHIIRVQDANVLSGNPGWIWLENWDFLRANAVKQYLGNGVYELKMPVDRPFFAGDKVIRPGRHIYNTLPASTQYGTVNKNTMLKAARITYECDEEVWRNVPFMDPLTF